jgi:chromosome segregation ATPase
MSPHTSTGGNANTTTSPHTTPTLAQLLHYVECYNNLARLERRIQARDRRIQDLDERIQALDERMEALERTMAERIRERERTGVGRVSWWMRWAWRSV